MEQTPLTEDEFAYIEAINEWEEEVRQHLPDVPPWHLEHDEWAGAAGAELRDDCYEPYPHLWDYNLLWCRIRYAAYYDGGRISNSLERPIDKIPGWIIRRALPYAERHYGRR